MFEFVDRYKKVKIGSKIEIKEQFLKPHRRQVPYGFIEWVKRFKNEFTVSSIQQIEDSAMISVEEVNGSIEYDQFLVFRSKRVLNWHKEKKL